MTEAGGRNYAKTKQKLKAMADNLRDEVNANRMHVLMVFRGRPANPAQKGVHGMEGRPYHRERLLEPDDLAAVAINGLSLRGTIEITDKYWTKFSNSGEPRITQ